MMSPTSVLVDEYETINGKKIKDDPSYDPMNPYVNRDPATQLHSLCARRYSAQWNDIRFASGMELFCDVFGASYQASKTG